MFNPNELKEAGDNLTNLLTGLRDGSVTFQTYDGEINTDAIDFYRKRFLMFKEDAVPSCINDYIARAQVDNLNDATKMRINLIALNIIAGGNGDV